MFNGWFNGWLRLSILSIFGLLILLSDRSLIAKPDASKADIVVYHGKYTETDLMQILFSRRTEYKDSYISVIGYSQSLGVNIRWVQFEAEGQLGVHSGIMKHIEANAFLTARTPNLFGIPFTLAIGEGLSLASKNPDLENTKKGFRFPTNTLSFSEAYIVNQLNPDFPIFLADIQLNSMEGRPLLNYMMVEAQYRFESFLYKPAIFLRVHHRSGVFGFYCPPNPACGSNFITYGVKMSIDPLL